MFNLLMTWENGGFDMLALELERGRFGEYTAEKLMKRFGPLKPAGIKKLKSFPTLFLYENLVGDARVGSLTEIRERNRHVLVEFQFDKQIAPFPAEKLKPLLLRLDMGGSELYRTHWAIKDEDLLQVLSSAGLVGASLESSPTPIAEARFKVALSFPGENRDYVAKVAEELKSTCPKARCFTTGISQPSWLVPIWTRFYRACTASSPTWWWCSCPLTTTRRNGAASNGDRSANSLSDEMTTQSC